MSVYVCTSQQDLIEISNRVWLCFRVQGMSINIRGCEDASVYGVQSMPIERMRGYEDMRKRVSMTLEGRNQPRNGFVNPATAGTNPRTEENLERKELEIAQVLSRSLEVLSFST